MKKIEAIIEKNRDGGFSVFCVTQPYSGMGNTAEAAKADMMQAIEFHKKVCIDNGLEYPKFLDGEYELVYKFDAKSLLEYYSGILTLSGMEKITGIHQKQLWKYLHGIQTPRKAQIEKIENGLHRFGSELMATSL